MRVIADAVFAADLFDDIGDGRQMDVTDPRKKMVLDLVVQAPHVPSQERALASEICCRLHLVDGPLPALHFLRVVRRERAGLLIGVSQLKNDAQAQPLDHRDETIDEYDLPQRVKKEGDCERCGKERELAPQEQSEVAAAGPRERVVADASPKNGREVIVELPLGQDKTIEDPHVEVLEALVRKMRLVARHPAKGTEADAVVQSFDIGVAVVEDIVFPPPDIGAAAEKIEHAAHSA